MKYVDEYRDVNKVKKLADMINSQVRRPVYKIMEVCGTHTASIHKFGLKSLLSKKIELISGPGCPVCVTSDGYLKNSLKLAKNRNIIVATYPDMLRVPVEGGSLEAARSEGADVRGVNSALEALDLAVRSAKREVVFLGVGFETTAPGTAIALEAAKKDKIRNFSVYSAHKTIPEALIALGRDKGLALDGFLLPGHVSAIIGMEGYRSVAKKVGLASVIAGFEPVDILLAILKIVKAANVGATILENEYTRIVTKSGNKQAQRLLKKVFIQTDSIWRGLGVISGTGLSIRGAFGGFDANKKFELPKEKVDKALAGGCLCAEVLKGRITPQQCPLFAKRCTPLSPKGPCMVSREGTCRAYFEFR
ncbi:MAG TPA: hydrogenase formation protein HypD [Candidatus Omnitrophica bacterium]|nr:hydrogenase formation protein HypD [Candidatus Omnitrophota bacterium]